MKIIYIKNGDAVDQVYRITNNMKEKIENGPDAFIYDFIVNNIESKIMVLSKYSREAKYVNENIVSIVYDGGMSKSIPNLYRLIASIKMLCSIIFFKPNKIICGCTGEQLWIAFLSAKLLNIPIVHSRHNLVKSEKSGLLKELINQIDESIIKRVDGVVAHGPFLKEQITKIGVKSGRVFEFDVGFKNTKEYLENNVNNCNERFCGDNNRRYILFVGRVESEKGVFDLLSAAKSTLRNNPEMKLIYIGDGSGIKLLKSKVNSNDLSSKVIILGKKDRLTTLQIVQSAFVLICPTRSEFPEGRCMVAMEGLALGVPVIAPNFGPFPYLIKHYKNGFLYKPNSIEDLSKYIEFIAVNSIEYLNLRIGAINSGKALVNPVRTFNQALDLAFG